MSPYAQMVNTGGAHVGGSVVHTPAVVEPLLEVEALGSSRWTGAPSVVKR